MCGLLCTLEGSTFQASLEFGYPDTFVGICVQMASAIQTIEHPGLKVRENIFKMRVIWSSIKIKNLPRKLVLADNGRYYFVVCSARCFSGLRTSDELYLTFQSNPGHQKGLVSRMKRR